MMQYLLAGIEGVIAVRSAITNSMRDQRVSLITATAGCIRNSSD